MAITFRASGTASNGNNASSLTPGDPGGAAVGDLEFLQVQTFGGTSSRVPQIPSGWTGYVWANGTANHMLCWRIRRASDSAPTVTMSGTGAASDTQLSRIHSFYTNTAGKRLKISVIGTTSTNASADNVGPITGLTVPSGTVATIISCGKTNDWNGTATLTNYTNVQTESTTGNDAGMAFLRRIGTPSGATGNLTVTDNGGTASNGRGFGIIVCLQEVDADTLDVEVLEGSTVIATRTAQAVTLDGYSDIAVTLDSTELGDITDPTALRVRITKNGTAGAIRVTEVSASITGEEATGGAGAVLAAAVTITSSVTASLSVPKPLGAAVAITSAFGASLQVPKPLAAAVSVGSSFAASLSVPKPLAAASSISTSVTAALSVPKPLAAATTMGSAFTAALTVPKPLAAGVSITSAFSAALTAPAGLAAAATIASTFSAALTVPKPLAAAVSINSSVAAALTVLAPISAAVTIGSAFTAALSVPKPLAASVTIGSAFSASLVLPKPLSAAVAITSALAATLSVPKALAADLVIASAFGASLGVPKPLTAGVIITTTFGAALGVPKALAADVVMALSVAAALGVPKPLAAGVSISVVLVATLFEAPFQAFVWADPSAALRSTLVVLLAEDAVRARPVAALRVTDVATAALAVTGAPAAALRADATTAAQLAVTAFPTASVVGTASVSDQ